MSKSSPTSPRCASPRWATPVGLPSCRENSLISKRYQHEIRWKPQVVKDGKALAVAYIDARLVADRLDAVVGIGNWQDRFQVLDKGVICRLELRIDGEWICKEGTGSESKQPDAGDRLKASFSNAFKLAAVKWGVGRYLYALPKQGCAFDEQRKQFKETPRLAATPSMASGQRYRRTVRSCWHGSRRGSRKKWRRDTGALRG